jgi:hypothetical protein
MTVIRGGEMAFPLHNTGHGAPFDEGMTLRDYFAAKAMQTMLGWDNDHTNWDSYAKDAYTMADAMLKHRDSGE